jgi:Ala-tRNA(Pro) deacylase
MGVPEFLTDHQVPFETIFHAPAFSAQKRAKYLHVPGKQVAKCVLLAHSSGFVLAVLPATKQIDLDKLSCELGGPVRVADNGEIAHVFRDCEWGVVPPFGSMYGLSTLLDDSLDAEAVIVFEGNLHVEAIRLRCRDYERLERPRRICFAN